MLHFYQNKRKNYCNVLVGVLIFLALCSRKEERKEEMRNENHSKQSDAISQNRAAEVNYAELCKIK